MSAPPSDTSPIDGVWQMVRAEMDGEAAPELVVMKTEMELCAGKYYVHFAGEVADRGTFELSTSPLNSLLVFRSIIGPNAGRDIQCIYQNIGKRLRVCCGFDGATPTAFKSEVGQRRYLATFRRK